MLLSVESFIATKDNRRPAHVYTRVSAKFNSILARGSHVPSRLARLSGLRSAIFAIVSRSLPFCAIVSLFERSRSASGRCLTVPHVRPQSRPSVARPDAFLGRATRGAPCSSCDPLRSPDPTCSEQEAGVLAACKLYVVSAIFVARWRGGSRSVASQSRTMRSLSCYACLNIARPAIQERNVKKTSGGVVQQQQQPWMASGPVKCILCNTHPYQSSREISQSRLWDVARRGHWHHPPPQPIDTAHTCRPSCTKANPPPARTACRCHCVRPRSIFWTGTSTHKGMVTRCARWASRTPPRSSPPSGPSRRPRFAPAGQGS